MMKKITSIAVMLFSAATMYGQNTGDLNRQISVAKDYAPSVDKAAKLAITPQMNDTVTLRPDFEYMVRPKAWMQGFSVSPIRPATVDAAAYDPQYPFYLKAGGGYPGQTLFDFYANTTRKGRNSLGFYLNHKGWLADIDVENRGKTDAKSTRNSTGVFGTTGVGRYSLGGEIGWDYDIYTLYGDMFRFSAKPPMQHYSVPRARIVFGDNFTDMSHLNFRLGADGYLLKDRRENEEKGLNAFFSVGKGFSIHNIIIDAEYDAYFRGKAKGTILRAGPRYELRTEGFSLKMGADLVYNESSFKIERIYQSGWNVLEGQEDNLHILPQLEMRLPFAGGAATPYLKLTSGFRNNSLYRLSNLNPYLHHYPDYNLGYSATKEYNLRFGMEGAAGSVFSYDVYVGADQLENNPVFYLRKDDGSNIRFESKRRVLTAGAELEARIGGGFTIVAAGRYFKTNAKRDAMEENLSEIPYTPKYTASLGMKYNYRDKLLLRAGADARGKYDLVYSLYIPMQYMYYYIEHPVSLPAAVDVSFDAQYNLSPRFGIFAEGRNLANKKLHPYPFYQGVGINVSAGVKVRF